MNLSEILPLFMLATSLLLMFESQNGGGGWEGGVQLFSEKYTLSRIWLQQHRLPNAV